MNFNEALRAIERGTNVRRTHLTAVLVGLVAVGLFAADAHAFYHPGMGVFTSRDPGSGGAMRIGAGGPAVAGGFIPRDPTGSNQYADGMNLYQHVKSRPIDLTDPDGLWTRDGVLVYLCRTDQGRKIVSNINARARILMSQHVMTRFHTRAKATDAWGPWQNQEWGAMAVNGKEVHLPKKYGDDQAALILAHEIAHVTGSGEVDAYAAETQLGLATIGLSPRWNEFVKTNDKNESIVDKDAIKKKVDEWYKGWHEDDPLKEYEQNATGGAKIDYGKEDVIKGWECKCPKEFYYYDYAYPPPGNYASMPSD